MPQRKDETSASTAVLHADAKGIISQHFQAVALGDAVLTSAWSLLASAFAFSRSMPAFYLFVLGVACIDSLHFRAPLEAIQSVAMEAVMPIFKAMVEAAEEIILRLHNESFAEQGQQDMTQASAYMQALTSHLTHCR